MKKVLFATTALIATAGVAAADVSLSGSANVGLKYNEAGTQQSTLHHEIDFGINASGTADSGLTFGASVDIDTDNSSGAFTGSDGEVFISGAFGTLTVGKVDAGDDQFFGAVEVGFDGIGLDDVAETGYGAGSHDVLYTYSVGDISVAASMSSSDTDDSMAFGVQYKGPVTVALGYNDTGSNVVTSVGVKGSMAGVSFNIAAVDSESAGNSYGLGLTYALNDAVSISAGFADSDSTADSSFGAGFTYAMGGGATLAGGFGSINDVTKADFGINFSF